MISILLLFLRIVPLSKKTNSICENRFDQNVDFGGQTVTDKGYFHCSSDNLLIKNCSFSNIIMKNGYTYSYFIYANGVDLAVEKSSFSNIIFDERLICLWYFSGCQNTLFFDSNTIISCSSSSKDEAIIVYTCSKYTTITHNIILFDEDVSMGQGYDIYYQDNCVFKNNSVTNANFNKGSGICCRKRGTDSDSDIQIEDCTFGNCRCQREGIIYITSLISDFTFQNITIEQTTNNYNTDEGYMLYVDTTETEIIFRDCKFSFLESNSLSGSIGLLFEKNKEYTIKFEDTIFEHLKYTNTKQGGGAISIHYGNFNQYVALSVSRCTFFDITSQGNGGAISIDSPDKPFSITDCSFAKTTSANDAHAIYINHYSMTDTITISGCNFTDCGSKSDTYVIQVYFLYFTFMYNKIEFSSQKESCSCIKFGNVITNIYAHNTFINASSCLVKEDSDLGQSVKIANNVFDGISGEKEGRCINIRMYSAEFTVSENTIQNCPSGPSLVYISFELKCERFKLSYINFINNSMNEQLYDNCIRPQVLIKNGNDGSDNNMLTVAFDNCTFINNYNPKRGGGLAYGKSKDISNTAVILTECKFIDNKSGEDGSALFLQVYQGCQIDQCEFIDNKSGGDESALFLQVYQGCLIDQCEFIRNECEQGSGTIYIETDFDDPKYKTSPEGSNPNVTITNCIFDGNLGDAGITLASSSVSELIIKSCSFMNSGQSGHEITVKECKEFHAENCTIEFTSDEGCGGISVQGSFPIFVTEVNFIKTSSFPALSIKAEDNTMNSIQVDECLFESCGNCKNACFDISLFNNLDFINNTIKRVKGTDCSQYIGSINCNDAARLEMKNNSFIENTCASLYGGGIGISFIGIKEKLEFTECKFVSNEARQSQTEKRVPVQYEAPYYNGDGGAIQIGFQDSLNNIIVSFIKCIFRDNKAERHGGAILVQTLNEVQILYCEFIGNLANYDFESKKSGSTLLFDDHFYKKVDGRGGAIYINPSYSAAGESYLKKIRIEDSRFLSNSAYDGYAMYIEGDEEIETEFVILSNAFIDNYNLSNYNEESKTYYGAVITSEIHSITRQQLNDGDYKNSFYNENLSIKVKDLIYVDHYGHTASSQFTESNYLPSKSFTLSEEFTKSIAFSKSSDFSESNAFEETKKFSESYFFSESAAFSKSKCFSQSSHFSESNAFDKTRKFSESDFFSESAAFSKSKYFSQSSHFSESNAFDKTKEFSESATFSGSKYFSQSTHFSESETLEASCTEKTTPNVDDSFTSTGNEFVSNSESLESESSQTDSFVINSDNFTNSGSEIFSRSLESVSSYDKTNVKTVSATEDMSDNGNSDDKISSLISSEEKYTQSPNSFEQNPSIIEKDHSTSGKKNNLVMIIGIVAAAAIVIVVLIAIIIIFHLRKKLNSDAAEVQIEMDGESNETFSEPVSTEFNNPLSTLAEKDPFEQAIEESEV